MARKINKMFYRKSITENLQVNFEAKKIASKFIYLLYRILIERVTDKEIEFKKIENKLDEYDQMNYAKIINCYNNVLILLNKEFKDVFLNKEEFTPIDCYSFIERSKFIVMREIFNPLRDIESESNFIHKLKNFFNGFSNLIKRISFGQIDFGFFKPKPVICEMKSIINELSEIEGAINAHFGIQI